MAAKKDKDKEKEPIQTDLSIKDAEFNNLKFEDGLQKLEKTLADLESDELSLEDAITKYEEGTKYYKFCKTKLESLEKKIEIIMKNNSTGEIEVRPYTRPEIEE